MKKFDWKPIGDFVGQVCEVALYGLAVAASWKFSDYMTKIPDRTPVGYDDAVSAIMKSSMYSHDKARAAAVLKRNENAEFYRAIVHIANDSKTYSHDKVKLIEELSEA